MPDFATSIQHRTRGSSQSNQATKINTRPSIGKEKVKLSLFADEILYVENPKGYIHIHVRTNK